MEAVFDPRTIERPDDLLMRYYGFVSLLSLFMFPIVFVHYYLRFRTLRYRFDDDGISMSWGLLFRREINLTYRRIQDIHVTRNILQRWMGLATVAIQTASGSATPEMQIEGILRFEELRDYLYAKMRGARGMTTEPASSFGPEREEDEALMLLRQIAQDLRALRRPAAGGASEESAR